MKKRHHDIFIIGDEEFREFFLQRLPYHPQSKACRIIRIDRATVFQQRRWKIGGSNVNKAEDKVTRVILQCVDILLLRNTERTVLGILLGITLGFLAHLFSPAFKASDIIDVSQAPLWGWVPFGIIIVHMPMILWDIFHKPNVNDDIDTIIRLIEEGNFAESEKRQIYRNLVTRCVSQLSTTGNFTDTKNKLEQERF